MNTELVWFKSSYSGTNGGDCIEIAESPDTATVHVRDSKTPGSPVLNITPTSWHAFVAYAKDDVR